MDIESLRNKPFLDDRSLRPDTPRKTTSTLEYTRNIPDEILIPPMIFHSAFCCSTLMAKALDSPDLCLALKEPHILMSLANAKRMMARSNRPSAEYDTLFRFVMHTLGQIGERPILLKPTNAANNLLEDVINADGKVMFMFASLEDFLISVLKKGESCKSFIRTQYNIFSLDHCALAHIDQRQAMTYTDLQVVALIWRHQLELFECFRNDHLILRDVDFLSKKTESMTQTVKALGLPHSNTDISTIINSDVFTLDSKFKLQIQNAAMKKNAAKAIRQRYKQEIDSTLKWATTLRLERDISPNLRH